MNFARFALVFFMASFFCTNRAVSNEIFFDNYTYGDLGFRKIENKFLNIDAKEHFIIAGDSNVFGDGCHDGETLTSHLSQLFKKNYVYDWGIRGGGPHDSLYLIQFQSALSLVTQKKGVFVYDFFPFLYERVIGSKNYLKWTRKNSPYYDLDNRGELIYQGAFGDRKFITGFYNFINSHKWLDWLIPKLPQIHSRHIKLTAKIFSQMKKLYLAQFPEGRFVVAVNNTYDDEPAHIWQNKRLVEFLVEEKIDYIILNNPESFKGRYTFKDGHINPEGQKKQALLIKQLL